MIIYQEQAICLYQAYLDDETSLVAGDPLDLARKLADQAVTICRERSVRGYPSALNRAARIIGDQDADQGLELLEKGIAAAKAMSDGWFYRWSWGDVVESADEPAAAADRIVKVFTTGESRPHPGLGDL